MEALGIVVLPFACGFLVIMYSIGVLFLLTLQRALSLCSPQNRTMKPAMVWLNLIPILHPFWQFYTVINVGASLKNEFVDRRMDYGGDYGKSLGIGMLAAILFSEFCTIIGQFENQPALEFLGGALGLVGLIMFIMYSVRIDSYGTHLRLNNLRRLDGYDDDGGRGPRPPISGPRRSGESNSDITAKRTDNRYS